MPKRKPWTPAEGDVTVATRAEDLGAREVQGFRRAPGLRYAFDEAARQWDSPTARQLYRMMVPDVEKRPAERYYTGVVKPANEPRRQRRSQRKAARD